MQDIQLIFLRNPCRIRVENYLSGLEVKRLPPDCPQPSQCPFVSSFFPFQTEDVLEQQH
jgi:hypothetical protein